MNRRFWVIGSAALNAVLLVVIVLLVTHRRNERDLLETDPLAARTKTTPVNQRQPARTVGTSARSNPLPVAGPAKSRIQLKEVLEQLRAAGVGEEELAEFVNMQLNGDWRNRQRDLQRKMRRGEADPRAYWQLNLDRDVMHQEEMKALLGPETFARWDKKNVLAEVDGARLGLSASESDALYQLLKDRHRTERELERAHSGGMVDQVDYQSQRKEQQADYEQRLVQLLGPERAARLKSENDWNLGRLRWDLRAMNLGDAQLDAVCRVSQQTQEKQQELQRLSQAGAAVDGNQWQQLETARQQEFRRILGEQGYAEYQKRQDYRYQQMQQYATAWQLTPADMDYVYQTIQDGQRAVEDFRKLTSQQQSQQQAQGQPIDWQQPHDAIRDFNKQTETQLRQRLGDERFEKLQRAGVLQFGGPAAGRE